MLTYAKACEKLARSRNKENAPLENNTRLIRLDSDTVAVKFHATNVLTIASNGTYTYNTADWRTLTTKARMNKYGPVGISQAKGMWSVGRYGSVQTAYFDGMQVSETGVILTADPDAAARLTVTRTVDDAIRAYIRGFVAAAERGEIDVPSGGDCWLCSMFGEHAGTDHILSHIGIGSDAETYFVPSLLYTAILERASTVERATFQFSMRQSMPHIVRSALRAYFNRIRQSLITATMEVPAHV